LDERAKTLNRLGEGRNFFATIVTVIAAMDFFTVPLTLGVFYCFFVSPMTDVGIFISMPRSTRLARGCGSSCAKLSLLNECDLKRIMNDYVRYCHEDRTHLGLAKETPRKQPAEKSAGTGCSVISLPRLGGLHHRLLLEQAIPGMDDDCRRCALVHDFAGQTL
jgi:hypothetical protein